MKERGHIRGVGCDEQTVIERYHADSFDRFMELYLEVSGKEFVEQMNQNITTAANRLTDKYGGGSVCMLSIGSGRDLANLHLDWNPNLDVVGVDINPNMIAGIDKKLHDGTLDRRPSIVYSQISEASNTLRRKFDLVVWAYSGSCVQNPIDSWKSAIDLLRPGGTLIFNDYIGAPPTEDKLVRAQHEASDVARTEGMKLYPATMLAELDKHRDEIIQAGSIISVAGDLPGTGKESIVFDPRHDYLGISRQPWFEKRLERVREDISVKNVIASNVSAVYRKR